MNNSSARQQIRGYCSQCSCYCRIISHVCDGVFTDVKPDREHPLASPICPKAIAGPELVYNKPRLQYPMKRMTVEKLRLNPAGIVVDLNMKYQKYRQRDANGNVAGFPTTKRIEIYSQVYKDHGYDPLPSWREPSHAKLREEYPLMITGGKVVHYCHSQHRALPSLRRAVPHPFLEINPKKAGELGIKDED
jgi:anaerobic selenocysteine-containing dehydrogenase